MNRGALYGFASAALFGASTPLAKALVGTVPPLWLAALLYLGAGAGLLAVLAVRGFLRPHEPIAFPTRADWRWIGGATALGGVAGPIALMYGLAATSGATAALLLNLEAVLTAVLAWFLFGENFDRRIALGMAAIVAGAAILAATPGNGSASSTGPLLVALACLCWALDNNLTRKASASDAVVLATIKGLVAGTVSAVLANIAGATVPSLSAAAGAAVVGFLGYGVSLVLFILALRHLGTARAGAYFSVAPFFGAVVAVLAGQDTMTPSLGLAAALMGVGVWLHVSEHHAHAHRHESVEHTHAHTHDLHHGHEHAFPWDGAEPHVHRHVHHALTHSHPHYPDVHHRHPHRLRSTSCGTRQ
jgi:drug/metabolite transporter (DMT)-like permease